MVWLYGHYTFIIILMLGSILESDGGLTLFTIGPMYRAIRVVEFRGMKRLPFGSQTKHGTITQFFLNVGPASNTLTGIGPAVGCDAGPTLNRY